MRRSGLDDRGLVAAELAHRGLGGEYAPVKRLFKQRQAGDVGGAWLHAADRGAGLGERGPEQEAGHRTDHRVTPAGDVDAYELAVDLGVHRGEGGAYVFSPVLEVAGEQAGALGRELGRIGAGHWFVVGDDGARAVLAAVLGVGGEHVAEAGADDRDVVPGERNTVRLAPPGSQSNTSLSSSGTMVMNTAPRMPPRMEPMPPTMMAARKKIDISSGKLSGVTTRKKYAHRPPATPA